MVHPITGAIEANLRVLHHIGIPVCTPFAHCATDNPAPGLSVRVMRKSRDWWGFPDTDKSREARDLEFLHFGP